MENKEEKEISFDQNLSEDISLKEDCKFCDNKATIVEFFDREIYICNYCAVA
jgi:ribosomal protein L37AE/L43A